MLKHIRFVALAALFSACVPPNMLVSWPNLNAAPSSGGGQAAHAPSAPKQGALLKLVADVDMGGSYFYGNNVYFERSDDPPNQSQRFQFEGDGLNRFPNDLVLVPLKPGSYNGIEVVLAYTRNGYNGYHSFHLNAPAPMNSFAVEPGKVAVLGTLNVKANLTVTSTDSAGIHYNTNSSIKGVSTVKEKLESVDEALSRPEAESRGWKEMLEAVRTELAAQDKPPKPAPQGLVDWIKFPAATFMMGSGSGDEGPVHRVALPDFELSRALVTNKQYQACVDAGACTAPDAGCLSSAAYAGDDNPVACVDFGQARAFASWTGARLPSEAEWEYAARSGGKSWTYPWGTQPATCELASMAACGVKGTAPVCSKPKGNTEQGLCDMVGNLWEWIEDWYQPSYDGAPVDGAPREDGGQLRVQRGGFWNNDTTYLRSYHRGQADPDTVGARGFRLARD